MLRRLFTCLILLALPLCVYAESLRYEVKGVEGALLDNVNAWLGAPPVSPEERLNFVVSAETRAEQSLQALGYYRPDVDIVTDRSDDPWRMTIVVITGEPVRIRDVRALVAGDAANDDTFTDMISRPFLVSGNVFHHGEYEAFKRGLQALGQRRGYFDGRLLRSRVKVDPVGGTADVLIEYDSGVRYRFGQLNYNPEQLEREQLLALQPFAAGDYYSAPLLQRFQSSLQRTGFFSSVVVGPQLAARNDGVVPVELELFPAKRHGIDLGVGYSTDTEERVSVTWRTPRINRFGHSQESRIQYSPINPSGRTIYSIPLTHPLNDTLQLSARLEENEFGDIDSQQAEVGLRREVKGEDWLYSYSIRGLNESWDVGDFDADSDYLLPGVTFSHKYRQGPLVNPLAGFSQFYSLEGASESLGSDVDLVRAYANYVFVAALAEDHRLVLRGELGAVSIADKDRAQLAPSLNFFAGGSQSIRGYSYQSLGNEVDVEQDDGSIKTFVVGGARLLTASAEYQYSINETWRAAVFADAGDAFDEGEFDANYGVGFGVHYMTPVGAIKLELANPVGDDNPAWRFHVNIGAEF
jgi:translocation and assembly module TamA